jgi:hypothetical protein
MLKGRVKSKYFPVLLKIIGKNKTKLYIDLGT